uniref:Glycylpeptide N-tetradecanoyltransferase n=1 Tax=Panagrellus redivivus TaxID=6233 RepID=A0A7E4VLR1_PANRE
MAAVFRKNPICQTHLRFHRLNLLDEEVLAFFDYYVSLPSRPMILSLRFEKKMSVALVEAINDKYNDAGFETEFDRLPTTPFNSIEIGENDIVYCKYFLNYSLSSELSPKGYF